MTDEKESAVVEETAVNEDEVLKVTKSKKAKKSEKPVQTNWLFNAIANISSADKIK